MSDWAGVLEVCTWTYYSAEANTQIGRIMHKIRISRPKIVEFSTANGKGTPPAHTALLHTHFCVFYARLAPPPIEIMDPPLYSTARHHRRPSSSNLVQLIHQQFDEIDGR